MKTMSQEDSAYIIARLCSERLDIAAIKYYLQASPTARDFRNRFTAALFREFQEALHTSSSEYVSRREVVKLAERFTAAREGLEKRLNDSVHGFPWEAGGRRATLAAIAVLEEVRNLARAYGAIRFDPYGKIQPALQS